MNFFTEVVLKQSELLKTMANPPPAAGGGEAGGQPSQANGSKAGSSNIFGKLFTAATNLVFSRAPQNNVDIIGFVETQGGPSGMNATTDDTLPTATRKRLAVNDSEDGRLMSPKKQKYSGITAKTSDDKIKEAQI